MRIRKFFPGLLYDYQEAEASVEERGLFNLLFRMATETEGGVDIPRAEKVARQLASYAGEEITSKITWVDSPWEGESLFDTYEKVRRPPKCRSKKESSPALMRALQAAFIPTWGESRLLEDDSSLYGATFSIKDLGTIGEILFSQLVLREELTTLEELWLELFFTGCFAMWLTPGEIILCGRPVKCRTVNDDFVVRFDWP